MKLGSSKRKTTTKLSTTAPNNQWFRNVIKSAGYATADIIKETIPSTFEFVETNGKDAIQLYNDLRQEGPKSVTKLLAQSMDKNAYVKIAKEAIANTREDLKSGNFYNKEREERSVLGDDADLGGDDFDFSFDEDEFSDFGDGDSEISSTSSDDNNVTNVKKVTVNNINANITRNNPMVQAIDKQSDVILASADASNKINTALATTGFTLTSKIASDMMTGISTVNDNLTALVNFNNDSMSKYVAASLQYYSDSLSVLNSTLEHLKGPAQEEKEEKEQIDPFLGNGALNIKSYTQLLKKNMSNVIQDDLLLNSMYSFASDTDTIKMLAASPLKIIPKMISKVIVPTIVRESAAEFDKSFSNFFPALLNKFNKLADDDNWFLSKIGKLFGFKPKSKTSVDISQYNKGDISFNGITQKAITEVIPTYLRKILSAINGQNEMVFDYQSGKFTDYMKAIKQNEDIVRNKSLGSMELYSDLKTRLGAIRFTDDSDKEAMYKDFDDFMYKLSRSNGINPHVRTVKGETVDELKDLYSGQFSEIFRSAILSLNKSDIMKLMGSDIFSAKSSVTNYYEEAEKNIGTSLIPVLESWDSSSEYEKGKNGEFKRKDSLKSIPLDKFGKSSLDYMREMRNLLVEGILVYPTKPIGGHTSGVGGRSQRDSEIFKNRQDRLKEIEKETTRITNTTNANRMNTPKTYTPEEIEKLRAKGIVVADSVSDIVSDLDNSSKLSDMFSTYAQLKDSDNTATKDLGKAGNWVSKLFSKGGKKVESIRDVFDNIFSMPGRVLSNVFNELDNGLYKLVFGVNKDGSEQSFISRVVTSIKSEFTGFFDWTKETFFSPLHEALLGDEGIITKLKKSEAMERVKKLGNKMADWAFGNLDENGHRRDGAFSDAFNEVRDLTNSVGRTITGRGYTDRHGNVYDREQNSVFGHVNGAMSNVYENARLYLTGNRRDRYTDSTMLVPTVPTTPVEPQPLDPLQSLYTPESAASQTEPNAPVVMLNRDDVNTQPMGPSISPFIMGYHERSRNEEGNGGFNVFDWMKNNLKLQYSIGVNGEEGTPKTINFGQDVEGDTGSGGVAPTMVNGFPYFSQRDPRYAHVPYNLSTGKGGGDGIAFGDRGCGPTAMSMVATGLGKEVDPLSMADLATETGHSVAGGTKGSFFKSIGEKLGFNAKEKQTTESKVESAITQGKPIIFRGRKTSDKVTPFTPDGHFVVGVGGKDGKVKINDPNGVESSGEYDIKDIVSESNKMWTFDDTGKGAGDLNSPFKTEYQAVKYKKKKDRFVADWARDIDGNEDGQINGVVNELADGFKEASADMLALIFGEKAGEEDKEKRVKEFGTKFREVLPKGIAGGILGGGLGTIVGATGGMGLLGSFFLPGGPIGGALLGTALGFTSQSEKFKNWLFGEKDPEDQNKRLGGFISAKTQKFFKDHKTTIVGGAALGGLKGMLMGSGFLGSMLFGGPITGALMGAGLGLALRSEKFKKTIFGEDDEESGKKIGGLLSKSYNSLAENKKMIGGAGIGILGGAATGAVLSSMGILGSAFFLGPAGGAIVGAGLGIAAASEKWRDKVFGVYDEDDKKRKGGLLEEVKRNIVEEVLEPIKLGARETADSFKFWFEEKIIYPVADFFGPMKTAMGMMFEDTIWAIQDIGNGIKARFEKYVAEPMGKFMQEKIFEPIKKLFGGMWKAATWVTQKVLQAPFSVLGMANKGAAGFVEKRAQKRKKKSDKAASQMAIYEQAIADGQTLSLEDQIKYENLKKRRDRYFIAEDDERLNALSNYEKKKETRQADLAERRKTAKEDLDKRKAELKQKNEFRRIFGAKHEFNPEALEQYKSLFSLEDGRKIKGRRAKRALGNKAEEFIRTFNSSGKALANEDVKDMKTEIKENLSPMRKALMSIEDSIKAIGLDIQNNVSKIVNKLLNGVADENTMLGKTTKGVGNVKRAAGKTVRGASRKIKGGIKAGARGVKRGATFVADTAIQGATFVADTAEQVVDGTVQGVKTVGNAVVDVSDKATNKMMYGAEDKLARARKEKERLKAERDAIKAKADEANGGRKDASWIMSGKGKEKAPKEKKDKKGGLLSSFGSTMFGALKRFDKVNDKEEEEKAKKKDQKAKLSEKQKAVSGKNYVALQQELTARNKEVEEKSWKQSLLSAVTNIKTKTEEHGINWSDIFSKKGLITGALLLALPKITEFLKNPAEFIKNTLSSVMNGIKISIGWLFGKDNASRTDADGETIVNGGLAESTARLTRNGIKEVITNKKVNKVGKAIYETGKKVKSIWDDVTTSKSVKEIAEAGFKGADGLVELGVKTSDDLVELGIKSADDLAKLGLKGKDDLAKVGIKYADDFAKFGIDITSSKGKKQLSSLGIKYTDELVEGGIAFATNKKTVTGVIKEGASTLMTKASTAATDLTSKTMQTVVDKGNKVLGSQFVTAITDWLKSAFSHSKVIKLMGKEASEKTLSHLLKKVTTSMSESVLGRFSKKISEAIAKTAGRAAGAVGTAGVLTVAFGVADVISGAVNAERLFEIPPGTATVGMRTMASVLQFILGLGMVGPIIDVANEIIAEVTGISFLSIIASAGYSCITEATGGDLKLKDLQSEFDADYEAYKEANNLPELSKRAYQDIVNPSMGTKIGRAAKSGLDFITGDFTNGDKIKKTLGKDKDYKVTISDRFSQMTGNVVGGVTFGLVDGDNLTRNMANGINNAKEWTSNAWNKTKKWVGGYDEWAANNRKATAEWASNTWDKTKDLAANAWDVTKSRAKEAPHNITGNIFNDKKIREELGISDDSNISIKDRLSMGAASLIKDLSFGAFDTKDTVKKISDIQTNIATSAKNMWTNVSTAASETWEGTKEATKNFFVASGKQITGLMGLYDENGEPLPFTKGMPVLVDKSVEAVKGLWDDTKNLASNWWNNTKQFASDSWTGMTEFLPKAATVLDESIGTMFGLRDDDGNPVSLTRGASLGVSKFLDGMKNSFNDLKDGASAFWEKTTKDVTEGFNGLKDVIPKAMGELNKGLGKLMGFEDSNGNPISVTDAVKDGWSKTVSTANNLWTSFKTWISNGTDNTNQPQVNKNTGFGGYGGFGGEEIPTNIGARGCGPTAMAMVASKLTGQQVDPVIMSNLATQAGFAGQYGTNGQYFKYAADKFNINASEGRTTEQNLTQALNSGQPVILRGQSDGASGSAFTRSGHYVVAVGQKDGKVIINDPRGVNYSGAYDMKDVVSQSNVMWSFGNGIGANGKKIPNMVIGGASTDDIPGELIYKYAAMQLGKPYVWGANGPNSFDCSGLVNHAAREAGVKLPSSRPTAAVWKTYCKTITKDQLRVGDLGFYREKNGKITHVAIYAGDGQWCHAEGGSGPNGQGGKVKVNSPSYLNEYGRIPGVVGSSTAYVGNSYQESGGSTKGSSRTDTLSNITGFMSSLGSSVINSIITGQPAQFMTFDEYLSSNGSNSTGGENVDYLNTPYTGETVSLGSRKTDAATLNKFLGGKLAQKGSTIVRAGQQYGVDPAFAASILHHESGNGTSNAIVNYNNPGGIMDWENNWKTLRRFSSLDAGIDFTVSNLKKNYLDKGLKTIPEIGSKYAPIGAANDPNNLNVNWVPNVTKLYNQYSYDAGNGGFGDTEFSFADGGFGGDDYVGTQVNTNNTSTPLFKTVETPVKTYTFNDRTSNIGMGENYVQNLVQEHLTDTSGTSGVTDILEKVLNVLAKIADNTGVTSKNIKDAITTVMTNNTSVTTVNSVNGGNTITKRTVDTNAQYSESEVRNRNVAQRIAQGIFV